MPKPPDKLSRHFKPAKYLLEASGGTVHLAITGQKIGPPGHRISLHQSSLKIIDAKIIRFDKHGPVEIEVIRINHLPTVQQVRLHGKTIMYPGRYQIDLKYKIKPEKLSRLGETKPGRELLPSIDEADAWQSADFELIS